MRVAVAIWVAEYTSVLADTHKVYSPCVDSNGVYCYPFGGNYLESADNLVVKSEDVPVEVSASLDYVVWKTCQFSLLEFAVDDASEDSASAGGSQVDRKEIMFCHSIVSVRKSFNTQS